MALAAQPRKFTRKYMATATGSSDIVIPPATPSIA
tara:strand:+ start:156 stop:260 length:105 start_codon:yes stop_codon:yes gene_type:complete